MQLTQAVTSVFRQLDQTVSQLSSEEYSRPCATLSNHTIGQHLRHIIELFQCLEMGYEIGTVNYEKRHRDTAIETDKYFAASLLKKIHENLDKADKDLVLEACYDEEAGESIQIPTNYYREIAYNLEHSIHHMALMRIGINEISSIELPENFGIAGATIKFRKQCAQ